MPSDRTDCSAELQKEITSAWQNGSLDADRLKVILETIPSGIVVVEKRDGRITYVNSCAIELISMNPCGMDIVQSLAGFRFLRPDGTVYLLNEFPIILAMQGKTTPSIEIIMERPDGKRIYFTNRASPVSGKDGETVAAVGIFFDITERKLTEAKLRENEERFRTLYETMAQGVIYRNARGELLFANKAVQRIMGIHFDQMRGTNISEDIGKSIHEDGTPFRLEERTSWLALHTGKEVRDVVMGIYNPTEKKYRWVIVSSKPLFRPGEDKPYEVYTTSEDITPLKEAQDELRQHHDHLEELVRERTCRLLESEERYRKIADSTPDFIYSLDRQERYTTVNQAFCEALKLPPEGIISKDYRQLGFLEEITEERPHMHRRVLDNGETVVAEVATRMPDGQVHTYDVILSPICDDKGDITGLTGIHRDITIRKRAEDELRNLSRRLVNAQEEERESIARELHDDIGQSLTVLSLKLAEMKRLHSASSNVAEFTELQDMVKEITAGIRHLSTSLHPGMLKTLGLQHTLEWYTGEFARRTSINIDFECSGLEGKAIPQEIGIAVYRILQESLTNITRYAGVKKAAVGVRASPIVLVLEIKDEGAGFKPESVPITSSGIRGMRERADALGGVFAIESAPGKGTRVRVMLPIGEAWQSSKVNSDPMQT